MSNLTLRSITAEDQSRYRLSFDSSTGEMREYVFGVDESVVPVVEWPPEFAVDLGYDVSQAQVVLAAVLASHEARKVVLADRRG
jgi:hypothetical protein